MCFNEALIKLDLLARINESRGPSSRRQNNEKRQRGNQVKHDLCNNMICYFETQDIMRNATTADQRNIFPT